MSSANEKLIKGKHWILLFLLLVKYYLSLLVYVLIFSSWVSYVNLLYAVKHCSEFVKWHPKWIVTQTS